MKVVITTDTRSKVGTAGSNSYVDLNTAYINDGHLPDIDHS